jgi:Toprim domain
MSQATMKPAFMTVAEIAAKYNALAKTEGPRLLRNGTRIGSKWIFSGIADNGITSSAWLELSGSKIGRWMDAGNCAAGEEKGDLLDLLALKQFHGDRREALQEAKRILGIADPFIPPERRRPVSEEDVMRSRERAKAALAARERQEEIERAGRARAAKALWLGGEPIDGTPAEAYLRARKLTNGGGRWPAALRYYAELPHAPSDGRYPALVAAGFSWEGEQRFVHRIWLARRAGTWGKIDDPQPKMALGALCGNFIPINKGESGKSMRAMPEDERIYITEGIEDAIVARMEHPEFRIIAAVTLGNIASLELPPQARTIVIIADRDEKPAAQDALERAIAAHQKKKREVLLIMPPVPYKDMNDWLIGTGGTGRNTGQPGAVA